MDFADNTLTLLDSPGSVDPDWELFPELSFYTTGN